MSALATSADKQFTIRQGTKADCATVLDFVSPVLPHSAAGSRLLTRLTFWSEQIQQLADYEKEPDAVKATVQTVRSPLPPLCICLILTC